MQKYVIYVRPQQQEGTGLTKELQERRCNRSVGCAVRTCKIEMTKKTSLFFPLMVMGCLPAGMSMVMDME